MRIAAAIVDAHVDAASIASGTLRAAMTTPSAMIDDPTYSGWPVQRYGPDA